MATALEKGDRLEGAVELIESAILKSSPAYAEDNMLIERKKIVSVAGVRHEIDVFVTVEVANGYETIFIFECKNWANPVGKNEIIVFSEKIEAVQAQRGFFVARNFSKDAMAQSAKDGRITLLRFAENSTLPQFIETFHVVLKKHRHSTIKFIQKLDDKEQNNAREIQVDDDAICLVNGELVPLRTIVEQLAEQASTAKINTVNTVALDEGTHSFTTEEEVECDDEYRLIINNMEIVKVAVTVEFDVDIIRPAIVSKFIVEKRGRVHQFAPVTVKEGQWFQISFVEHARRRSASSA